MLVTRSSGFWGLWLPGFLVLGSSGLCLLFMGFRIMYVSGFRRAKRGFMFLKYWV